MIRNHLNVAIKKTFFVLQEPDVDEADTVKSEPDYDPLDEALLSEDEGQRDIEMAVIKVAKGDSEEMMDT